MPIRADHRHFYSKAAGWPAIRLAIITRARGCCERCGLPNRAIGFRDAFGVFIPWGSPEHAEFARARVATPKPFRIVLTIAHLDQNPANNDHANLRALCQRCHITHDARQHADNASATNARKREVPGQQRLFAKETT